jgi:hypothetical protein
MKKNNGITLTSLIIYVTGMLLVVTTIATLTSFFYKNIDIKAINNDTTQYTKFSSIFGEEINRSNNSIIDCKSLSDGISYIVFSSGNQYTFNENSKSIYKDNVKICDNVELCDFSYTYQDSKYKIKIDFKTSNIDMSGNNAITYNM